MITKQVLDEVIFNVKNESIDEESKNMIICKLMELYPVEECNNDKDKDKARINKLNHIRENKRLNDLNSYTCMLTGKDEKTGHIKRYYNSNRRKVAKRISEKKIRQYKGHIDNGSCYKKLTEYQWNIW